MFGSMSNTFSRICSAVSGRRSVFPNAMALHTVDVPTKTATFAQGCFWAPDSIYGATLGVIRTCVGYSGGTKANPTYHSLGDHTEAIKVDYDSTTVSYQQLLDIFWKSHAPTQRTTTQYTSIIFYHDDEQKKLAEESFQQQQAKSSTPFVTTIRPASTFYDAEDYHQKYRLQGHPDLLKAIGLKKNDPQLKTSFIAARLNGYVVGRGGEKQFNEEAKTLGLDDKTIEYVRKLVIRHQHDVPTEKATFCMGCYWAPDCTFGVLAGVVRTRVGHAGSKPNAPCSECHEAIEIDFDPTVITYSQLLDVFWLHHDPTEVTSVEYQSVILYHTEEQRIEAEKSCAKKKRQLALSDDKPILTQVLPACVFYDADEKNQKYRLQQHPWLMEAIGLTGVPSSGDSAPSLKTSHVAARLNGYVVGAGGAAQFDKEVAGLGLSEPAIEYVGKLLRESTRPTSCGTGSCGLNSANEDPAKE